MNCVVQATRYTESRVPERPACQLGVGRTLVAEMLMAFSTPFIRHDALNMLEQLQKAIEQCMIY